MNRRVLRKYSVLILFFIFLTTAIRADVIISEEELIKSIEQINNIRKQFIGLCETGCFNHMENKSNDQTINLAKVYIKQIIGIRKTLEGYKDQELNKFSLIKIEALIATSKFLDAMGEHLINYLSTENLKEQYDFYNIILQTNQFIRNILSDVQYADYGTN